LAAVDGRTNSNVALHQPTFMSSVWNDPTFGAYVSSRAVDGNKDPELMKVDNSCINTQYDANPWWAVDLEAALVVVGILFTNRGDGWGKVIYIYSSLFTINGSMKLKREKRERKKTIT